MFTAQPGEPMFPDVAGGGGGGGSVNPGLPMSPAKAGILSARLRKLAATVDFILFISVS